MGLLQFSRRTIAARAVRYAIDHIPEFAQEMASRFDVPVLSEADEGQAVATALHASLLGIQKVLEGQGVAVEVAFSKRDLVKSALALAAKNIEGLMGEGLDIPGIPEELEVWAGKQLRGAFDRGVIWAASTALLD